MITLVIGGMRSGKSEIAERLVGDGAVTYLATGVATDEEMRLRIDAHRRRRPPAWATIEEPTNLVGALKSLTGPVLLDTLGTWVANTLDDEPAFDAVIEALARRPCHTVVVSDEVGMGVHPPTAAGRRFADRLGELNQGVAAVADRCLLVVAGRVLELGRS